MFTGLIEEVGIVAHLSRSGDGLLLEISAAMVTDALRNGDSITVNGACQTVTQSGKSKFAVFVSKVTAAITTLGSLKQGDRVNLERAMTLNSRLGGHFVQGHVDGRGMVTGIQKDASGWFVDISADAGLCRYVVARGSIAIDGISLTVVRAGEGSFAVYIVPETLSRTIAGSWEAGTHVNLEADIIAKYIEKLTGDRHGGNKDETLLKKLQEEGFA